MVCLRPIQMPMQKSECAFAVDGVRAVEKFKFGAVANFQHVVVTTDFAEFFGNLFGALAAVPMAEAR